MKKAPYEVIGIGPDSWRIEDSIVRAFLFAGRERALLVDSTTGAGDLAALVKGLTSLPVLLVNTHADEDHIGCNSQFPHAWMHPAEFAHYARMGKPGAAAPMPLQDGEVLDLGGRRFQVVLIPGHTCGGIALLNPAERFLICGDAVSSRPVFLFGSERNPDAYQASLHRLKELSGDFDLLYPSHGEFPLGKEQLDRQAACLERLRRGELTPMEPPFPMPARMYQSDGAGFYFREDETT